jgi:hypothetical protein
MRIHAIALAVAVISAFPPRMGAQADRPSAAKIVHHFSRASTVIEQGDTVTWIHTTRADSTRKAVEYTLVYLLRPDTVILLKPNGPRPLKPMYAKAIRDLLRYAREQDELEKELGHSP